MASDAFDRDDGPIGNYWKKQAAVTGTGPAIISGELGSADGGAVLIHCSEFPFEVSGSGLKFSTFGSLEVEVEGQAGDSVALVSVAYGVGSSVNGGFGIALQYEILESSVRFTLGGFTFTTMVVGSRIFSLPGGPGIRQKIRLCWSELGNTNGVRAVGEVYDAAGELVFRDRILTTAVAGPAHGLVMATSSTLRLDNYRATIPDESDAYLCPECVFPPLPNLCLQVEDAGCGIDPTSLILEPSGPSDPSGILPAVAARHADWAKLTGPFPDLWQASITQEPDGRWTAYLVAQPGAIREYFRAELLAAGSATYPTTDTLIALMEAATFTWLMHDSSLGHSLCWEDVTGQVSTDLELCGYYETPPDDECQEENLPDTLTMTITGPSGTDEITITRVDNPQEGFYGYLINAGGYFGNLIGPETVGASGPNQHQVIMIEPNGDQITLNHTSCSPYFASGSGSTFSVTISE